MITLGQASNYSAGRVFRHLFAWGTKRNSENLRRNLAKKYQVQPHQVALYHTGRSALTAAILAVSKGKNMSVIIPGLTCIAVVRAAKAAGCTPVFVDIQAENLEYNYHNLKETLKNLQSSQNPSAKPSKPNQTIDNNKKACYNGSIILVQNTLGITWNAKKLEEIAQEYNATLVEDLAHSAGRIYPDGREVGTVGVAAALSFGKGKAIDTISGGAVIVRGDQAVTQPTQKPRLSDRLRDRWYPVFGGIARGLWGCGIGKVLIGGLVKIHFVQRSADAELDLSHRLTHWQAKLASRQLAELPQGKLRDYRLVNDRDAVLQQLEARGYCLEEIWYDTPVSPRRYAKEANFPTDQCPETVKIAEQIVNFPTWYSADKLKTAYDIVKEYEIHE